MNQKEIDEIVKRHQHWLKEDCENWRTMRADFTGCILTKAEFDNVNLNHALFGAANLKYAFFNGVRLRGAFFADANLTGATFIESNLKFAFFNNANLSGAKFFNNNLYEADFHGSKISKTTELFIPLVCPDAGEFIGWKKVSGKIVCLKIQKNAKRLSATGRKCRCDCAKVINIQNLDGADSGLKQICSDYDSSFIYKVGKTVKVDDFCEDRWNKCSAGIHFFITREEAVNY